MPRLLRLLPLWFFLVAPAALAEDGPAVVPAPPAGQGPVLVTTGIYLTQISEMSLKDNSFSADFYVWFRWQGHDELKPLDTFELVNGRIESKTLLEAKKTGDTNYACARVVATVVEFFDLHAFPLDSHVLEIEIEDGKDLETDLRYVNDATNTGIDGRVKVRGYAILRAKSTVVSHTYRTNYGDDTVPTGNGSTFSRYVYSVEVGRSGASFLVKLYWTVFLATVIALLAFRVKPNDLDPRFGLGVGAIFACAASTYVISGYLPDTDYLTLADKLNILAVFFIFASIAQSTIALKLFSSGREKVAEKLDTWCFWGMLALYSVANLVFIAIA